MKKEQLIELRVSVRVKGGHRLVNQQEFRLSYQRVQHESTLVLAA